MTHLIITAIVVCVLAYAWFELRAAYGARTLLKLFGLTIAFFYVKEFLQANNLLLHHYYHSNRTLWAEVFGVPPFIVFGHLFVVVMTWQLGVRYLHRLKLTAHPAMLVTFVWFFTSTISMLMESTGVSGGWWSWAMPSWWFYPNLLGAPLIDLPWERPITTAWGYFITVYWFMALSTDVSRRWTIPRLATLLVGLAALLELSRSTPFMSAWGVFCTVLPFISIALASPRRKNPASMVIRPDSALLKERGARWYGAVNVGLAAMIAVCILQIAAVSKWMSLVALYPILIVAVGSYRLWPLWVDWFVSAAVIAVGFTLNNGNVMLAGWLVFRFTAVIQIALWAIRWREKRRAMKTQPAAAPVVPEPEPAGGAT